MYAQSIPGVSLELPARRLHPRAASRSPWVRRGRTFVYLYLRLCRKLGRLDGCAGRYY